MSSKNPQHGKLSKPFKKVLVSVQTALQIVLSPVVLALIKETKFENSRVISKHYDDENTQPTASQKGFITHLLTSWIYIQYMHDLISLEMASN